jgi:hypothetical protein
MPQERYNAEWVKEENLGIVVRSFRNIVEAVQELLSDDKLEQFRQNARRLNNRAVFEIPEIFEQIMISGEEPADVRPPAQSLDALDGPLAAISPEVGSGERVRGRGEFS